MNKLKILFVSEYFPPKTMGGGEINLSLLAKALVRNKIDVCVLTSYHKGLKKFEYVGGIKVYRRLKTGNNASGIISNFKRSFIFPSSIPKEIIKLKKEINFDIVHFIGTSIITAKKLKGLNKPMFATIESYPALCPKGDRIYKGNEECKFVCSFFRFLRCQLSSSEIGKMKNRFFLKYNPVILIYIYRYYKRLNNSLKYCRLIAISKYVQGLLLKQRLQSRIVPNAIDTNKFYSNKSKGGKIRIVYLGSLTKYKGSQILLKAIKGIDCRCDLYGEGVMKDELNNMIRDYRLDAEIHDNVPYEKVPLIYADADIVVFPSIWPEPFGRIAIEAMAAGKPVVGSRIGAIQETIKDDGILVEAGNVEELKNAIKKLIQYPKLRKKMGKKGSIMVRKMYSEGDVIKKLIGTYKEF